MAKQLMARPLGYVLAGAGVVVATAGRLALATSVGPHYPFLLHFLALLMTMWLCGFGPSVFALFLGSLAYLCFIVPSLESLGIPWAVCLVGLLPFLATGTAVIAIFEAERKVRRRLEREIEERQRLEERSSFMARVLESMTEGVSISDESGTIIYTNPAEDRIFGYGPGELVGQHVSVQNDYPPEENARIVSAVIATLKAEGTWTGVWHNRKKDGTPFWSFSRITSIRRDGLNYWVCVQEDITERKRLSEQLEEERNLLDALFASTPVGLGFVDAEFRFRRVNRAVSEINGVPVEDHIGRPLTEVLPELWPTIEPLYRKVLETGEPIRNLEVEGHTPRSPGERRSWLVNYYPVRLGGSVVGVGFTIIETTEAHQREARLRDADEMLKDRAKLLETVLATTPTPIWIAQDRECREISGNPASYKFLKTPVGSVVSATAPDQLATTRKFREYRDGRPVDPHDLPMQVAAREGVEVHDAEFSMVFDDGSVRHLYGNAVPLRDENGRVTGAIAAYADVTRLKEAEEALRETDRRKDEFLAMLAHELRNPLAPIRNAVSILEIEENNPEVLRWSREIIDRQSRHLSRLVDDLLDVSRITQGKITLTKSPVEVSQFIHAAVESSRPVIDARHHHLEVTLTEEALRVLGDFTRLSQVVLNLLNNAAKYTPEGGHIRVHVRRDTEICRISVRDDGLGIAPQMLSRVFELFTQANRSLDRSQGGLGVGLTLVQRLVEMHGGSVEAHSDGPGKGSEFVVLLPLLRAEVAQLPAAGVPDQSRTIAERSIRILVVEDSNDARESLSRLLRRMGHQVEVAHDGASAIETGLRSIPDVVLLDIGLPGMDGYEVARRLRREPSLDGSHLIALTGYGSPEDRRKSRESGFDDHLVKPVEFEALLSVLERTQVGNV